MTDRAPSEFSLNAEDFSFELNAVSEMIDHSVGGDETQRSARTRVAGANAATLLLAATFEEYIRQQVRAAFKVKIARSGGVAEFPTKFARGVWRRSLEVIAKTPWEEVAGDTGGISARVGATLSFCLKNDVTADIADVVARNENNMRPVQLVTLFAQIGLSDVFNAACSKPEMIAFAGASSVHETIESVTTNLEGFFRRRNSIAHSIAQNRSSGAVELKRDIEMFRTFSNALARAIEEALSSPHPKKGPRRKSANASNMAA